jgi:hypothetical protein
MIDLENMPAPTQEQITEARENAFNAQRPASSHGMRQQLHMLRRSLHHQMAILIYGMKLQLAGYHSQTILEVN